MTRVRPKPQPILSADGSAAVVLRDEVVLRLDTANGDVTSLLAPFAADQVAVAPSGRLVAVAGGGEVAVIDYRNQAGETRWSAHLPAADAPVRMAVDDDGLVVMSSSDAGVVARAMADGAAQTIDVPKGFHESLVLIPGVGAHIVVSGEASLSAVVAFDAGELVPLDQPDPYGAVRIGKRLGVYSMESLRVYDVDGSGSVTVASEHALDGVERVVSNPGGTEVLTVAAKWDGEHDVLHLERIAVDSDRRTEVDSSEIGRNDALALTGEGEVIRAYGALKPGRVFAVRGGRTAEVEVDAEVAHQRT